MTPLWWNSKRPGLLIPVFFLLGFQAIMAAQDIWPEASTAALGGAFVTSAGYSCAGLNQAGLGAIEQHSITLQHSRPYLLRELDESSLSGQFHMGNGALGMVFSSRGIKGLRQSSLWFSYGMRLHPAATAGVGFQVWNTSLAEQLFYASGMGLAVGVRINVREQWMAGTHVHYPVFRSLPALAYAQQGSRIAAGLSYTFLKVGTLYAEIHIHAEHGIILLAGLEWTLNQRLCLKAGYADKPFTLSWGMAWIHPRWSVQFAFQYRMSSGSVPLASLSHAW
jgi:hypothetical protein